MDTSEYILNEFGLDMASEKVTREMSKLIENKNDPDFKEKLEKLIIDREEILKGNSRKNFSRVRDMALNAVESRPLNYARTEG